MKRPRIEAQQVHIIAEAAGHTLVWRETPTGYAARCGHPNCRIAFTVDDDGSPILTLDPTKIPMCPLNTDLHS